MRKRREFRDRELGVIIARRETPCRSFEMGCMFLDWNPIKATAGCWVSGRLLT